MFLVCLWVGPSAASTPIAVARIEMAQPGVTLDLQPVRFGGGHRVIVGRSIAGRPVIDGGAVVRLGPDLALRGMHGAPLPPAPPWPIALAEGVADTVIAGVGGRAWGVRTAEAWLLDAGALVPTQRVDLVTDTATWRGVVHAQTGRLLRLDRTSRSAEALVYPESPVAGDLERVQLLGLSSATELLGRYTYAASCEDWEISDTLFGVTRCHALDRHAEPDAGGHYLFAPDPGGIDDPLAEVQVYHHTDRIAAWADETFGVILPFGPIRATVNFPMTNAFYGDFDADGIPDLSFGHDEETGVDFAYDADVVYHEFGHALVAALAPDLPFMRADTYGIDWAPGSLNEGTADVFAMLMTGDPQVGSYAGAAVGRDAIRDLTAARRCPDDLAGEVHRDGEVLASLGWQWIADPEIGAEVAADLLVGAIPLFAPEGTWPAAGRALGITAEDLAAVGAIDPATHAAVVGHLAASGIEDCGRVVSIDGGIPHELILVSAGLSGDYTRIPAGVQLSMEVPAEARQVRVFLQEVSGPEGFAWTVHGRMGEPVGHDVTEIPILGLATAVPTTWDWRVDGEGNGTVTLDLDPAGSPRTVYLSLSSRNTGALPAFDFTLGRATVAAIWVPELAPPEAPSTAGCASVPGGAPWLGAWGIGLLCRSRRRAGSGATSG